MWRLSLSRSSAIFWLAASPTLVGQRPTAADHVCVIRLTVRQHVLCKCYKHSHGFQDRETTAMHGVIGRIDDFGRPAWIVLMVLGFIVYWPIGLAVLAYII